MTLTLHNIEDVYVICELWPLRYARKYSNPVFPTRDHSTPTLSLGRIVCCNKLPIQVILFEVQSANFIVEAVCAVTEIFATTKVVQRVSEEDACPSSTPWWRCSFGPLPFPQLFIGIEDIHSRCQKSVALIFIQTSPNDQLFLPSGKHCCMIRTRLRFGYSAWTSHVLSYDHDVPSCRGRGHSMSNYYCYFMERTP